MTTVAAWSAGHGERLVEPDHGRATRYGPGRLLLGFAATADAVPLDRLDVADRAAALDAAGSGAAHLRGSWTLVDAGTEGLRVTTDFFGTRPLFWRRDGDAVRVADDIWSVADGAALDPLGACDLLLLGEHVGGRTLFAGVRCSEAGTVLHLGRGGDRSLRLPVDLPQSGCADEEEGAERLAEALGGLLDPYRDLTGITVPLSGGLDSRVILASACDAGLSPRAWTYAERPGCQEERYARAVAQRLGVEHEVVRREPIEVESAVGAFVHETSAQLALNHLPGYPFARRMPSERPAAFGPGGENVCGGALLGPLGHGDPVADRARRLCLGHDPAQLQDLVPGVAGWADHLLEHLSSRYAEAGRQRRLADLLHVRDRSARLNVWAPRGQLPRREYLVPFLDREVARTAFGLPAQWRDRSAVYRAAIVRRWPEVAGVPWAKTGLPVGRYPGRVRTRLRRAARRLPAHRVAAPASLAAERAAVQALLATEGDRAGAALAGVGVDAERLVGALQPDTALGRALRYRLATVGVALRVRDGDLR